MKYRYLSLFAILVSGVGPSWASSDPIEDVRKIMAGTVSTLSIKQAYLSGARDNTAPFQGALKAYKAIRAAEQPAPVPTPVPVPTPTPTPQPSTPITYNDIVTAIQPCASRTDQALLTVGAKYKVKGLYVLMPVGSTSTNGKPADGMMLNPVIDDGMHRNDGWFSLWVPLACVSKP